MKRDMELIRRILLETEDMPFWKGKTTDPNIQHIEAMPFWKSESAGPNIRQIENHRNPEGFLNLGKYLGIEDHSAEEISFHVKIMAEAGLIEVVESPANSLYAEYNGDPAYIPTGLTWWGYEFLEAIKDDSRWSQVKVIMNKVGGFVFELAKPLAIDLMKKQILSLLP